MKNRPSIVCKEDICAAAGGETPCSGALEKHHIFYGTANRRLSDSDGLTCYLCAYHHRGAKRGVHGGNRALDVELKQAAQAAYMRETGTTTEGFIKRYGKNYLEVED